MGICNANQPHSVFKHFIKKSESIFRGFQIRILTAYGLQIRKSIVYKSGWVEGLSTKN